VTLVPVVQGHRYASGIKVPLVAALIPGSPLSALKKQAEAEGVAHVTDPAVVSFLADLGWSEVTAYQAGRAPMVEPLSDHELVIIATRSGASDQIDTEAKTWGGGLRWIEESNLLPGVQPRPPTEGATFPAWVAPVGLVALLLVGVVVVVSVSD
jgi:hypothetical protein